MDRVFDLSIDGTSLVDRFTDHIHDSAESFGAYGNTDGSSGINDVLTSDETFGGVHGNCSDSGVAQMLSDLEY